MKKQTISAEVSSGDIYVANQHTQRDNRDFRLLFLFSDNDHLGTEYYQEI